MIKAECREDERDRGARRRTARVVRRGGAARCNAVIIFWQAGIMMRATGIVMSNLDSGILVVAIKIAMRRSVLCERLRMRRRHGLMRRHHAGHGHRRYGHKSEKFAQSHPHAGMTTMP